jgi:adenosylhomocysteine nucleosidase
VVKVISDEFDFEFPATERYVDSAGRFQETRFAMFATLRPWLWPRVLRLAMNSRRATRALCDQLLELVDSESAVPQ